jgi:hypothetical protein
LGLGVPVSIFTAPAVDTAWLDARLGMNRSPALCGILIVVLVDLVRRAPSLLGFSFEGVCFTLGPVPVKFQSETPSSNRRGELLAMFDFGESLWVLDADLEK